MNVKIFSRSNKSDFSPKMQEKINFIFLEGLNFCFLSFFFSVDSPINQQRNSF